MRVQRFGRDSPAMAHLLASFNYSEASVAKNVTRLKSGKDALAELDRTYLRADPSPPSRQTH